MNDRIESIIAMLWGSFLGLLMGAIVALFCMVGCTPASEGVTIDDAFVLCVCMQQQLAAVKETPAEFELPAAELKTGSTAGTSIGSDANEVLPRPASPAAVAPQPTPLLLYGYPGCEACEWIKRQFNLRGVKYTYHSVEPVHGVTYPYATRDGKHLNYNQLKELAK